MAVQREWFDRDYYKDLGVSKNATDKEITKAYRKLAKQFHPDANRGNAEAEDRFKEVSAAYDVLGDAAKRKEYDQVRSMGAPGAAFGAAGGNPFANADFSQAGSAGGGFRFEDLGDLFGGLFNRGGSAGKRPSGAQSGDDLETDLRLGFLDAINGVTTTVRLATDVECGTCHGSGAKPGTSPVPCSTCGGRGVLDDNQGVFSFSRPCSACGGLGRRIESPCPTCRGRGAVQGHREVKVRIPAGVADGQRIRLKGKGGAGIGGGPPGDLYVRVHVTSHPVFGRKGADLTVAVPVTYAELVLGAAISVPTLGDPVTVKVAAGTRSGQVLRVRGKGVPKDPPGDLLVTVELHVPKELSKEQRKAVEALSRAEDGEALRKHLGAP